MADRIPAGDAPRHPRAGSVSVYDALGRPVYSRDRAGGSVGWTAYDADGNPLPKGSNGDHPDTPPATGG